MITLNEAQQIAKSLQFETRAFVGGDFVHSVGGQTMEVLNPSTGKVIASVAECGATEVDAAVISARRAFEDGRWSKASPKHRKKVMLRFADLIERDLQELAVLESMNCGKSLSDAFNFDLPDTVEAIRWHAEAADKLYDAVTPSPSNVVCMVVREPIGVVGAVLPWNFPLYLAAWKIGPALASGNCMIIKPSEETPLTALRLAALAVEAGIPDGVLSIVPGFGETVGQAIGRHAGIDCVSFTGSGEVGRLFMKYAADSNMKRVVLECGGKSPAIVMPDAKDLRFVADQVALGALFCQGENCSAGSRLIVHESVKAELLSELKRAFGTWKVGDPLDPSTRVGAMISPAHTKRVLNYVEGGLAQGARLVMGGKQTLVSSGGNFMEPTLFDQVDHTMTIAREEIFGPVLCVTSFRDTEEAVRLANDTNYGLASSLYTDDLETALKVSRQIRAGTVSVNCFSEGDTAVPFGGYKESGSNGREKGFQAHDQYTETKSIWIQMR